MECRMNDEEYKKAIKARSDYHMGVEVERERIVNLLENEELISDFENSINNYDQLVWLGIKEQLIAIITGNEPVKSKSFKMDATPAEIEIYGNWFLTQGDVYWRDRYFYFRLKHSWASFTEYESNDWIKKHLDEINEWGMDYPQDEITSKEVAKLFWHLVVTKDPKYLEAHKKHVDASHAELRANQEKRIKGER